MILSADELKNLLFPRLPDPALAPLDQALEDAVEEALWRGAALAILVS